MNLLQTMHSDQNNEQDEIEKEGQIWNLISLFQKDIEDNESISNNSNMEIGDENVFKNEAKLVHKLTENNSILRRLKLIISWLELNSMKNLDLIQNKISSFTEKYCWEHTLHQLVNKERKIQLNIRDYVTELDPDAPIRQKKALHDLDQEDEHLILEYAYTFIRAGDFKSLNSLTQKLGHSWRSATFDGFKYYNDFNYLHLNDSKINEQVKYNKGNVNRDIWKLVVSKMISNVSLFF